MLHLSGIPAVVAAPCAGGEEQDCCMRHQTETGGDVIGQCGCPSGDVARSLDGVSVTPPSQERWTPPVALVAPVPLALPASSAAHASASLTFSPLDTSPPELSATGFRC